MGVAGGWGGGSDQPRVKAKDKAFPVFGPGRRKVVLGRPTAGSTLKGMPPAKSLHYTGSL